jgi:hypothetical protein
MVKVKAGAKMCWISKQNVHGWSLGFALGKQTFWLKNVRFKNQEQVQQAVDSSVVFVESAAAAK